MESFRNDISDNLNITISGSQMTESIGKLLSVMETICQREGLHFFAFGDLLVYGVHYHTLPDYCWDDVYEVGMLRKDYERFIRNAEKYADELNFQVRTTPVGDKRKKYRSPYFYIEQKVVIKAENVELENWISLRVSPFDKVPMAADTRIAFYRKTERKNRCLRRISGQKEYVAVNGKSFIKFGLKQLLYGFRSSEKAYGRLNQLAQKYNHTDSVLYQRVVGKKTKIINEIQLFPLQETLLGEKSMPIPFDVTPWTDLDMEQYRRESEALHPVELEILEEMERVCTKMNVDYFLCGGSLLGYQRYGGFIPWDDDIDCGMLRSDYERFKRCADQYLDKEKFFLQTRENDPNMPYLYIKLRRKDTVYETAWSNGREFHKGIGIDIFPFDYVPNSLEDRRKHRLEVEKRAKKHNYVANRAKPNPTIGDVETMRDEANYRFGNLRRWLFRHTPLGITQRKFDKFVQQYNNKAECLNLQYVASFVPQYSGGELDTIFPTRRVKFDGVETRIVHRPEIFLRDQYGDYEEEPLPHQQRGHNLVEVETGKIYIGEKCGTQKED